MSNVTAAELEEKYKNFDVKAEVVAADLVEEGKNIDTIVIRSSGIFTRNFRHDILHYENVDQELGSDESLLFIDVSREGIFDSLPQQIFYQPSGKKLDSLDEKIQEIRKQRLEDAESRKFFSVFEKEFNQCKIMVEMEERKSIFGMSDKFNSDLFTDIWGELKEIAPHYHKYLFQILPIAHKCRGNVYLSSLLLGFILNEKVSIKVDADPALQKNAFPANALNKRFLGTDLILGDYTPSYDATYKLQIGPIKRGTVSKYMPGGEVDKLLNFLLDYFIPFDANTEMELVLEKESESLFLRDDEKYCYLGYDSKI
jgi:type VI secretion system protein ImpH